MGVDKKWGRGVHRRANGELFREVAGYVNRPAGRCPYISATNGKNVGLALGSITNNSAQDVHCAVDADQVRKAAHPAESDEMNPVWFGVVQQFDWQNTLRVVLPSSVISRWKNTPAPAVP